ncbi:MAG: alpha/beta hydrolase [Clostridium sp.]|nr:alpha/beta hydrolase [Clostridium sp.]
MINERININDTAYFDTYLLKNSKEYNVDKKRPLVIVCPGGGYGFTSDREAEPIALKFNSVGLHSVVLWYTTQDLHPNIPEHAIVELAKTIKSVREHAEEWYVDPDKIIVCGFSAGGHLAANMSVHWHDKWLADLAEATNEEIKVNCSILGYPATSLGKMTPNTEAFASRIIDKPQTHNLRFFGTEDPSDEQIVRANTVNYISKNTPPSFIWHTFEDVLVDVSHSVEFARKMAEIKVPFELHIFEKGEHGLALCDRTTARKASHHNSHVIKWFDLCMEWLVPYID